MKKKTKTILINCTDEFYHSIKNNAKRNHRSMGAHLQWVFEKYLETEVLKSRIDDEDEFPEDRNYLN